MTGSWPAEARKVICPPGCLNTSAKVYGNQYYAAHSSICRAAIHSGQITGMLVLVGFIGCSFYVGKAVMNTTFTSFRYFCMCNTMFLECKRCLCVKSVFYEKMLLV